MNKFLKNILIIITKILIISSILFFLIKKLIESWDVVSKYSFEINYLLIILSLIILCIGRISLAYGWGLILKKLGGNLKIKKSILIFYKSQLSRYIPGVIWPYVGRVYLAKKEGIPRTKTFVSLVLETVFLISTSAIVSFLVLFPYLKSEIITSYYLFFIIAVGVMFLFHPKILDYVINIVMKKLKKENKVDIKLKYQDLLIIFCVYLVRWLLLGIAFIIFSNSIYPIEITNWPLLFGAAILSWLVGFLFVIVPGGIGVKEAVIVLLLQPIMPIGIAIIIALASRLWLIVGELSTFSVFYLVSKK